MDLKTYWLFQKVQSNGHGTEMEIYIAGPIFTTGSNKKVLDKWNTQDYNNNFFSLLHLYCFIWLKLVDLDSVSPLEKLNVFNKSVQQ